MRIKLTFLAEWRNGIRKKNNKNKVEANIPYNFESIERLKYLFENMVALDIEKYNVRIAKHKSLVTTNIIHVSFYQRNTDKKFEVYHSSIEGHYEHKEFMQYLTDIGAI